MDILSRRHQRQWPVWASVNSVSVVDELVPGERRCLDVMSTKVKVSARTWTLNDWAVFGPSGSLSVLAPVGTARSSSPERLALRALGVSDFGVHVMCIWCSHQR